MYFDGLKNHHHRTAPLHGLAIAFYAKPQDPQFAELLYRGAINSIGWGNPSVPISNEFIADPRMFALGLTVSKEFDDQITYERLSKYAEENFEPRYFGLNDSQFGFWFNLGENWPRGQLSALAMCAEVCDPGAWEKLFNEPNLTKYYSPSVEGIDFPAVSVQKAFHDDSKGKLFLKVEPKSFENGFFKRNAFHQPFFENLLSENLKGNRFAKIKFNFELINLKNLKNKSSKNTKQKQKQKPKMT